MVASKKKKLAYEESRLKRLEENKKRMEELNLKDLALALIPTPKPSSQMTKSVQPRTPKLPVHALRRSSRVADKPPVSYDYFTRKAKCSVCKKMGHYKTTCPNINQQATEMDEDDHVHDDSKRIWQVD